MSAPSCPASLVRRGGEARSRPWAQAHPRGRAGDGGASRGFPPWVPHDCPAGRGTWTPRQDAWLISLRIPGTKTTSLGRVCKRYRASCILARPLRQLLRDAALSLMAFPLLIARSHAADDATGP